MDIDLVIDFIWKTISPAFNPQKRIFWGYLGASVAMFCIYCFITKQKIKSFWHRFFSKEIWLSKSARLDYSLLLINRVLMLSLAPLLLTKIVVATYFFEQFHSLFQGRPTLLSNAPDWSLSLLFTFTIFIGDDLSKYYVHRLLHRIPFLWYFHKIHHDAEKMTPFTVYRVHPVESLLFSFRGILVQGFVIGVFIFLFGSKVSLIDIFGANIFIFLFNITGSNLRHSHIWITYGDWLEKIFLSPAQHQIHHSNNPKHFDRNFGMVLAIWDRLGKSLYLASKVTSPVIFGNEKEIEATHGLTYAYITPFKQCGKRLLRDSRKLGRKFGKQT